MEKVVSASEYVSEVEAVPAAFEIKAGEAHFMTTRAPNVLRIFICSRCGLRGELA